MQYAYFKNVYSQVGVKNLLPLQNVHICVFMLCVLLIGVSLFANAQTEEIDIRYLNAQKAFEQGNLEKSEKLYRELLTVYPNDAKIYNDLGVVLSRDPSNLKEGINMFFAAMKKDPLYAESFSNMASICFKIQKYDTAIQYAQRAIKLDPNNASYFFSLGWIYLRGVKDRNRAIELFRKSMVIDPNNKDVLYILGLAYADKGDTPLVLEQITALRNIKEQVLANALEDIIRGVSSNMVSIDYQPIIQSRSGSVTLLEKAEDQEDVTRQMPRYKRTPARSKAATIPIQVKGKVTYKSSPIKVKVKGTSSTTIEGRVNAIQ